MMGYIVVIEGTDGCGKQTQTKALYDRLKKAGHNVIIQSFPNYDSPSAAPVKMYLGGEFGGEKSLDAYQASALYAVDRMCTYQKDIKKFYEAGGIVLLDRYVQSNMLHQAGKIEDRVEVDRFLDWLETLEFGDMKLPRPDRVIFLDVPVEVSLKLAHERQGLKANTKKDIHEENPDHIYRAYQSGKYVSEKYGWDTINCTDDGKMKSIEEISDLVWNVVSKDFESQKQM